MTPSAHPTSRIRALYLQADETTKRLGHHWYAQEHADVVSLAKRTGKPIRIICACLAVLSPRCQWPRAKDACCQLLAGERPGGIFGHNLAKATSILASRNGDLIRPATAPKTWAFWQNLWRPFDPYPVTLDAWMFRAHQLSPHATLRTYLALADAYRQAAGELCLLPNQLQATIWLHARDNHPRKEIHA